MGRKRNRRDAIEMSRRSMLGGTAAGLASLIARGLPLGIGAVLLSPRRAGAAVVLDPANPEANFTIETAKSPPDASITPGSTLSVNDPTATDLITLYAVEPDIAAGLALDLVVNFLILPGETRQGADTGVRFVINDGTKAIYVCCIVKNNVKGIGLASATDFGAEGSYLPGSFVPVDWNAPNPPTADGRVTFRLRRTALGTAQIVEVNGVAPDPRVELVSAGQPSPIRPRTGPTVEFGCMNLEARATMDLVVFRVERVGVPVAGQLTFTRFRIRDTDSADRLAFRADYQLGTGTNGIDPATEPVTIKLSVPGWEFYSQTLNGFTVRGTAPRRRWTLNDAERTRTGIEQLVIDEDPNNTCGIFLRDVATELADVHFGNVTAEIIIGTGALADKLTGIAPLVEKDWGSGNWRFHREA